MISESITLQVYKDMRGAALLTANNTQHAMHHAPKKYFYTLGCDVFYKCDVETKKWKWRNTSRALCGRCTTAACPPPPSVREWYAFKL